MELEITEIDNLSNYEQIPENMPLKISVPKINVVKQDQAFNQTVPNQTIKPFLSGPKAKITRPVVPPEKSKISYDDILNKMGMFVANGKLHLLDENGRPKPKKQEKQEPLNQNQNQNQNQVQNSYIYNKYFQNGQYNQGEDQPQRPLTPLEYKNMLINNIIQKQRIKQMKSTKLISAGPRGDLNKLFGFSQK
jgi:hypothetical protein